MTLSKEIDPSASYAMWVKAALDVPLLSFDLTSAPFVTILINMADYTGAELNTLTLKCTANTEGRVCVCVWLTVWLAVVEEK